MKVSVKIISWSLVFFPQLGRTENIKNCLDPKFAKTFVQNYYFEEVQKIKVEVYDIDNKTEKLSDDDFLGYVEANLGTVSDYKIMSPVCVLDGKYEPGVDSRLEKIKRGVYSPFAVFVRPSPLLNWSPFLA